MRSADDSFVALMENPDRSQADRDATGDALQEVSVSMRHLVGSRRALEQPDAQRGEIDKLHGAGADFSEAYAGYASSIRTDELPLDQAYAEQERDALASLSTQVQVLSLRECEVQVGSPEDQEAP
ncbi:hypothetical protein ABZT27_24395 [Streptomyces sp. NPDC005389]|uniref:hypothetical protein n=1 Tax=Streptomyces sp. NPDC005389 TaxID=3157040 RepID=UPI0033A9233D